MSERSTPRHRLREVLLNAGAMLGVMSILLAATALVFGITPLVFRSGSMAPAAHTGDLGIAQTVPAAELRVGDIVTVLTSADVRVTHRIVELEQTDTGALLVLKGDANEDPDPEQYAVAEAQRLLFAIPRAGYVASWLSGPGGVFLGGLLVGLVFLVVLQATSRKPPSGRRRADTTARTSVVILGAALLATTLTHLPQPVGTLAAWNDSVDVTGASMTGYTVPKPVVASCSRTPAGTTLLRHATLTWPGVTSPPTTYTAVVSGITGATTTFAGTTTRTVDVAYNPGTASNLNKRVTVTLTPALTASPTWTGPTDSWQFQTAATTAAPTCGEKTAPTVTIADPDGTTRTASAMVTYMNGTGGCNSTTQPACGTMSDTSTITNVDYILRRVQGGVTRCWSGTAYGTDCTTYRAGTAATTTWRIAGANATVYATPGAFTLTVRVTDTWGNVTTQVRTFTVTA
jgi:signal peptidase I